MVVVLLLSNIHIATGQLCNIRKRIKKNVNSFISQLDRLQHVCTCVSALDTAAVLQ